MNRISRSSLSTVGADTIVTSLLAVQTSGPGFVDLTGEVAAFVKDAAAREGAVTLFIRHTSASLAIHEGPDDMPAHVKTMLTATSLHIPVLKSELALGIWQAIYLIEHRKRPHRREVLLQFIGACA
jgi:thiamine phosphate synthase YjbQ (UPF0047 family)